MLGPKEKRERALGVRLGLKGERSMSPKSAMVRKPVQAGRARAARPGARAFGVRPPARGEEQSEVELRYRRAESGADLQRGDGGEEGAGATMLELLERRVDNVVYRLGFAPSRGAARQLVVHGHIAVNGRKVVSPGFETKTNDIVAVREGSLLKAGLPKRREGLKSSIRPHGST